MAVARRFLQALCSIRRSAMLRHDALEVLLADGAEERRSALEMMGRHMRKEFTNPQTDNLIHSNAYETQTPAPDAQWWLSASTSIPNQH